MNPGEFEIEYYAMVVAQEGKPKTEEKIKENDIRKNFYFKRLRNNDIKIVAEAMERACEKTNFVPKLHEIFKELDIIKRPTATVHNERNKDNWLQWLLGSSPEDAKYYGHKLDRREQLILLKHLRAHGIQEFEPLDNCPSFKKFKEFMNGPFLKGNFGRLRDKENQRIAEYDDSKISTEGEKYLQKVGE